MNARDDGDLAFPTGYPSHFSQHGMSLRTYAAIKLCVPESGIDWLDDMIRQSQRDRFAGQVLAARIASAEMPDHEQTERTVGEVLARDAFQFADAMIAERKGGAA